MHTNNILPNVPEHFIKKIGKYLIASGVEQALNHIPVLFQQIGLPFLPSLLFLPLNERVCTHADLIVSYYLPAVRLKCQALKCVCFFQTSAAATSGSRQL